MLPAEKHLEKAPVKLQAFSSSFRFILDKQLCEAFNRANCSCDTWLLRVNVQDLGHRHTGNDDLLNSYSPHEKG